MPRADTIHRHPHATLTPAPLQVPVSLLMSPAEFQTLRRLVAAAKVSRSEYIRRLIADAAKARA